MRCPHCGKEIPDQSHYCLHCMTRLEEPVEVSPVPVSRIPKRLLLTAAAVLILGVAAGGYFLLSSLNRSNPTSIETISTESSSTESTVQESNQRNSIGEYRQAETGGVIFEYNPDAPLPEGDENGFIIENGVLTQYVGSDTVVTIPEDVTAIGERAFFNNQAVTEIILPEGLLSIGTSAFYNCSHLERVQLPASLNQIDSQAFSLCTSLTEHVLSPDNPYFVVQDGILYNQQQTALNSYPAGKTDPAFSIPDTVTFVTPWAFEGNLYLEQVYVPEGVSEMPFAFGYCPQLREIQVAEGNTSFRSEEGVLYTKDGQTLVFYPPNREGDYFDIPQTVQQVESNAFFGSRYLTKITVPEGVSVLNVFVFKEVQQLRELYLPASITMIDSTAFTGAASLPTIYTPENSVTEDFCAENNISYVIEDPS